MEKNIYLLNGGLSCNNILKSLNNLSSIKKNKKKLDILKAYQLNTNSLSNNGIYELLLIKKNKEISEIFDKDTVIFTSINDIESGLILGSNFKVNKIFPILNISDNKNLKSLRDIKDFKNHFAKNNNITKYWDMNIDQKKINIDLINLKNDIPKISWEYFDSKYLSDYKRYSFSKFVKFFREIMNTGLEYKNIIFVSDNKFIVDFLKKIKNKDELFDKNKDTIEYSSLFKINIKLDKNLEVKSFIKIYPTKYNFSPLKANNNNKFIYSFNNKSYYLTNSLNLLNIDILKKYNLNRCFDKKIIELLLENLKKNNNNKINKISDEISFDKIIRLINN